jgi:hypothetical protein
MQLFFWNRSTVVVVVVSIDMIHWFEPWWMMWLRLPMTVRLIHHTGIYARHITRNRYSSREDHHLLWCNFYTETEPLLVFSLFLLLRYSDFSQGGFCRFVGLWRLVCYTILGYLPGTSREIDLPAEKIIIYCDATFLLKPKHCCCCRCIYRHDTLIRAMVNDVATSASDGSFDTPYWDICQAHHDKLT